MNYIHKYNRRSRSKDVAPVWEEVASTWALSSCQTCVLELWPGAAGSEAHLISRLGPGEPFVPCPVLFTCSHPPLPFTCSGKQGLQRWLKLEVWHLLCLVYFIYMEVT